MTKPIKWLASTVGKRGYIARYLRESSPAGSQVVGTGNDRFTPGFMSCDRAHVVPAIKDEGYLESMLALCVNEKINAAVCLSDLDISELSKIRDDLSRLGISCFFPNQETALRFLDKYLAAQFFSENHFLNPETYIDLEDALANLSFPIVIKPRRGSASSGYKVCVNSVEAREHWHDVEDPMAQQFIEGRLVNVEACSDPEGKPIRVSAWERKKSVAGETLLTTTIEHDKAINLVLRLLECSPIPGPIDVDLIERDGELYVLEINTRFGGGYPGSHLAGADFTGAMVASVQGRDPGPLSVYKTDVTMLKELTPVVFDDERVVGP
ncbi:ATP-grasp domain-containing protein [Alcanivorax sp.]|uniref:ATP-grasp domain-containing protein n=1 Tax=Alcanivorax sp. TaxID=1872427 RepID=UPI003A8EFB8C